LCLFSPAALENNPFADLEKVIAPHSRHATVLRTLVELGADLHAKTTEGKRPLHLAALTGSPEAMRILVELGADLEAPNSIGGTAMHAVANSGPVRGLDVAGIWLVATDHSGLVGRDGPFGFEHRRADGRTPPAGS
jgi:hypothetical protein